MVVFPRVKFSSFERYIVRGVWKVTPVYSEKKIYNLILVFIPPEREVDISASFILKEKKKKKYLPLLSWKKDIYEVFKTFKNYYWIVSYYS